MRRLLALLVACTPTTGTTSQTIIGGTVAPNDTSTVLLVSYPSDKSVEDQCSAAVISPTILLTAAHCIDSANHSGYTYGVFLDGDASAYPRLVDIIPHLVPVAAVHPHPMYNPAAPYFADIGVVQLGSPLSITPLGIRVGDIGALVGQPARIVGYGQTIYQTPNQVRFAADTTVFTVDQDTVVVGDATRHPCLGDSGGPAIVNGEVIGVDSYTDNPGCTQAAHYRRTDTFAPFLGQYVTLPMMGGDAGVPSGPEAGMDPGPNDTGGGGGGGCATTGGGSLALALLVLPLRRRRQR